MTKIIAYLFIFTKAFYHSTGKTNGSFIPPTEKISKLSLGYFLFCVVKAFCLIFGLTGEVYAESFESLAVYLRENYA